MRKLTPLLLLALLSAPSAVFAVPAGTAAAAFASTPIVQSGNPDKTAPPEAFFGDEDHGDFEGFGELTGTEAEILKNFTPDELRKIADQLEQSQAKTPIPIPVPVPPKQSAAISPRPIQPSATAVAHDTTNDRDDDIETDYDRAEYDLHNTSPVRAPKEQPSYCRFRLIGTIPYRAGNKVRKWKMHEVNWKTWYIYDRSTFNLVDRGTEQSPDRQLGPYSVMKSNLHGAPIRIGPMKKNWRGYGITSYNFSWDGKERNARFECRNFDVDDDVWTGFYLDCHYDFDCHST